MAQIAVTPEQLTAADGTPLKISLARAMRRRRITAFLLATPLLLFVLVTFLMPIFDMLMRSVANPEVRTYWPQVSRALSEWDGRELPGESVFAALYGDLRSSREARTVGKVATRLNYEMSGMRSLIMKTQRKVKRIEPPYREAFLGIDKRWGELDVWKLIKRMSSPYTLSYYLAALDLRFDPDGNVVAQPANKRIYVPLFLRTFRISLLITALCLVLGFPISYLLATLPLRLSNLLMIMVLLPFWTSLLVRTTSWIVILQQQGVLNDLLVWLGIIGDQNRISMIYNQTGTIIAMTHILLPFMVLPLYSVMRTISPSYMRAAQSLGAHPWEAFWRVYAPLTLPGVGAGCLLVFILAIGYYITPALVGGTSGQLISNMIAYHMQKSLNWGLAAALGTLLLAAVLILYWVYNRLVGVENMKLG